jgi:hypothetical protein
MRWVVGEKIKIPAETASLSSTAGEFFVQKYTPVFSPLVPNADWDTLNNKYVAEPVTIYDLRYNRVDTADLLDSGKLNYMIDYSTGIVTFAPESYDRKIRLTFLVMSGTSIRQYPVGDGTISPAVTTVLAAATTINLKTLPGYIAGSKIIPGSEQFNRAFEYVSFTDYRTTPAILTSGKYTFEPPDPQTNLLFGNIYFCRADIGKSVKMDYQVADWGILHEDVTVDKNGYFKLAVQNPKIAGKPNYPREPVPWGLFTPMNLAATSATSVVQNNTVMAMVDMQTGQAYEIVYDPNHFVDDYNKALTPVPDLGPGFDSDWKAAQNYKIVPSSYNPSNWTAAMRDAVARTDQLKLVDMKQAESGILRVGSGRVTDKASWQNLRGRTLRVYYRAVRDWTLQIIRPPAQFWSQSTTPTAAVSLGWNRFNAATPNIIYVPGVYAGASLAIDYQTEDVTNNSFALATATAAVTNGTTITVDDTSSIKAGAQVQLIDAVDTTKRPIRVVATVTSGTQFTITTALTVSNGSIFITPNPTSMALCSLKKTGPNISASSTRNLVVGGKYAYAMQTVPDERTIITINTISNKKITFTPAITVTNGDMLMPIAVTTSVTSATNEIHGEVHVVPPPDNTTGASKIILRKNYKAGSTISVRGMSVTVRALWIQERSGMAFEVDGKTEPPTSRTISERWTSKSVDIVLPESAR